MRKTDRKTFIRQGAMFASIPFGAGAIEKAGTIFDGTMSSLPLVISTWRHGLPANEAAWKILSSGGNALDAAEAGVRVPEADPEVTSVGYGGLPDESGRVSLDACIMDWRGNCGAVSFLETIMHPISVARLVMEKTHHVMLSGSGALEFALKNGFAQQDLLTPKSKALYEEWLRKKSGLPEENHDTIGLLAIDEDGQLAGACTTSGLAWKMRGRVGDSPIIGAGLFVDGGIGAATATGKGEAVIKIAGSAIIVELMRSGMSPQSACEEAVKRIVKKQPDHATFQVGFLAINTAGEYGAFSLQKGFQYAVANSTGNVLADAPHQL